MEGDMVNSFSNANNYLVVDFFRRNLPSYVFLSETSHGSYWGVTYAEGDIEIRIGGDIGFGIDIFIDKKEYHLWQYDRSVNSAMDTTEKNILYQLDVLKKFLR
ncbi:MAG: hypothetical protein HOO91_06295 [Bacteroidales bacterium]|nr:hypothetical protein [Bacteroidales bacterium]